MGDRGLGARRALAQPRAVVGLDGDLGGGGQPLEPGLGAGDVPRSGPDLGPALVDGRLAGGDVVRGRAAMVGPGSGREHDEHRRDTEHDGTRAGRHCAYPSAPAHVSPPYVTAPRRGRRHVSPVTVVT